MTNDILATKEARRKISSSLNKTPKMTKTMEPDRRLEPEHNSFPKARQLSKFRSYKIFSKKLHISPPRINVKFHVFFLINLTSLL